MPEHAPATEEVAIARRLLEKIRWFVAAQLAGDLRLLGGTGRLTRVHE